MKNRFTILLAALSLALPSFASARLGDTEAELKDRYGKPTAKGFADGSSTTILRFPENELGLTVVAHVTDGKCNVIEYESAKEIPEGIRLSLARANLKTFPEGWKEFRANNWMNKDGDIIAYDAPIEGISPAKLFVRKEPSFLSLHKN